MPDLHLFLLRRPGSYASSRASAIIVSAVSHTDARKIASKEQDSVSWENSALTMCDKLEPGELADVLFTIYK